jgi:hypothetical protein
MRNFEDNSCVEQAFSGIFYIWLVINIVLTGFSMIGIKDKMCGPAVRIEYVIPGRQLGCWLRDSSAGDWIHQGKNWLFEVPGKKKK